MRRHEREERVLKTDDSCTGFCHDLALILYVYLPNDGDRAEESVLTVRWSGSTCMRTLLTWHSTTSAHTAYDDLQRLHVLRRIAIVLMLYCSCQALSSPSDMVCLS